MLAEIIFDMPFLSEYDNLAKTKHGTIIDIKRKKFYKMTFTRRLIPMEDFFRNVEITNYRISPDGKHFSYLAPWENRLNIFVQPVAGGEPKRLTSETLRGIEGYGWANDNNIIFLKDVGGDENYQLFGVNTDTCEIKEYCAIPGVRVMILDILENDDDNIMIATNEKNPQVFDPYRLNLNTGERTLLYENPGNIQDWGIDHDGKLRVGYAIEDGVNTVILYRDNEDEDFREVLKTNFREEVSFAGFTPDNKQIYALTNIGRDKTALVLMQPDTCEELELLYENPHYDIDSISYSDKRNKLTAVSCMGHKGRIRHFFDKDLENTFRKIESHLPGYNIGISDSNRDEDKMIVIAHNDRNSGKYYFYDVKEDSIRQIGELKPWLKEEEMASMTPIRYEARDGLMIEGYLTLPMGYDMENAKDLSLVVNPHGGPWHRDTWGFNSEVQFLANRGYAVLQMNFRGSTGYGRDFKEKSYKQWGGTMQDDITDGVNYLINKNIVNKNRIAIYGASYGGYATLSGITKTPDLYACAIDYVGVSNLFTFMNTIPPYWKPLLEMMHEMVGNPEKDKAMMTECSPVYNVDKIKTPLFIAQGANDPRVNKAESDQMVEALRNKGIDIDYMVKYDEGHGFHNEENRFDFYRAMEHFLERYI